MALLRVPVRLRASALGIAIAALCALRCADNPATAPFLDSGGAEIELRLVDGPLAPPAVPLSPLAPPETPLTLGGCEPPPSGFPEDVQVTVSVHPPSGATLIRSIAIPARTQRAVVVEGLAPGDGYHVEVEVVVRGLPVFEGRSFPFVVFPGGRTVVPVDLSPPFGRRAVLAIGRPEITDTEARVPVLASHSQPVRGIEFEFCFDPGVLEPIGAQAVGSRVADFRGTGGQTAPGIYHAILWSPDPGARLVPGRDKVLEIAFRLRSPGSGGSSNLVFQNALVTDSPDSLSFSTYFFDGQVRP